MERLERDGLFHLYYGPGKGKTTAAVGATVRAAGHGNDVRLLQFAKGGVDRVAGEVESLRALDGVAVDRYPTDHVGGTVSEEDAATLREGLADAAGALDDRGVDAVVLDEVTAPWSLDVVPADRLVDLLDDARPDVEVICTGRAAPPALVDRVHYCSYVAEVKHPYRTGVEGRPGIEW
jgi:cob(I)alamin adenosyltransferase